MVIYCPVNKAVACQYISFKKNSYWNWTFLQKKDGRSCTFVFFFSLLLIMAIFN